jgi:hypothetical protein
VVARVLIRAEHDDSAERESADGGHRDERQKKRVLDQRGAELIACAATKDRAARCVEAIRAVHAPASAGALTQLREIDAIFEKSRNPVNQADS